MNLSQGIERYVAWKRGNGYKGTKIRRILSRLIDHVGDIELVNIRPEHMLGCLNRTPIVTSTWIGKYWMLRRFFEFCSDRGEMPELEMPKPKINPRQNFVPYIFTRVELRHVLEATKRNQRTNYALDQPTLRTIVLLLYATGL